MEHSNLLSYQSSSKPSSALDDDVRGNGNGTRIHDAWNNSNLLSYQSSSKPSSALDDDVRGNGNGTRIDDAWNIAIC